VSDTYSNYWKEVHQPESDSFHGKAHGWIQWKGTSVCIDLHCLCGAHGHVDAEFFYHYECAKCHRKYAVGMNVALIELNAQQAAYIDKEGSQYITDLGVLDDDEDSALIKESKS
jgi:hypothetical protein